MQYVSSSSWNERNETETHSSLNGLKDIAGCLYFTRPIGRAVGPL